MIHRFLTEELPFLPIVHVPSFRQRYQAFDRSFAAEDPFFAALLFAIAGWETHWKGTDPRTPVVDLSSRLVQTYVEAAMEVTKEAG
jgi:hypothetical protein